MAYHAEWQGGAPADQRFGCDTVGCVPVCFLDHIPLSSPMTYSSQHSDPIATAKAPDTTYYKSIHLADELKEYSCDTLAFQRHDSF